MQNDVLIIGMGPAGLSAAIYTARAGLRTIVFGIKEAGHLYKAHTVSNYFGFPEDVNGHSLIDAGLRQAKQFGAKMVGREIISFIINDNKTFTVKDTSGASYHGKAVIIATGTSYAISGIKNEEPLIGKGVSHCVTCDGFFFRDKKLAVIGNGNYVAEEALNLLSYSKHVTILSHGKDFDFSDALASEVEKSGISLKKTPKIREFTGENRLLNIVYENGDIDDYDGVFLAIGTAGAMNFAKTLGIELQGNYIHVNTHGETNIPGIYAAGNCTGADPQAAVSVGQGCSAAMDIIRKMRGTKVYLQYN